MSRCPCGKSKPDNAEKCIRCRTEGRVFPATPDPNTCTVCGFEARSRAGLVSHVQAKHGEHEEE